jgi:Sulfotransferase family
VATYGQLRLEKLSRRLIAVDAPRVFFLSIPKCGCTFTKNVLWYLQFGEYHSNPLRVHDDDDKLLRASDLDIDPRVLATEPRAFTVVRSPIDRFLSLYFDKVVGSGRLNFVPLASILIQKRGLIDGPITFSDHQYNLSVLSDWIEENITEGIDMPRDGHWTPQIHRSDVMRGFNLKVIPLEFLSLGIERLVSDCLPNIDSVLAGVEANRSIRLVKRSIVLSRGLRRRVNGIYAEDRRLYRNVIKLWSTDSRTDQSEFSIPRFSDVWPN